MAASITSLNSRASTEPFLGSVPNLDLKQERSKPEDIKFNNVEIPKQSKFWDKAKKYAGIVDSRESLVRLALEFFGGDIPWVLAGALRNRESFFEKLFECSVSLSSFLVAPALTGWFAKLGGKIFMPDKSGEEILSLINLNRHELRTETGFKEGVKRVLDEEPADKLRIAQLYREIGKQGQAVRYDSEADKLRKLFTGLEYDKDLAAKVKKIKEFTTLAESQSEGLLWGGFGLMLRAFRKYVLKQDRFTGTEKYLNDKEAKKIGQGDDLKLWQKIGGFMMMPLPAVLNYFLMKLTDNEELVKNNKFLQMADKHLDMTHGLFPKLGLMFTYTSLPKWLGTFITAQGWDELVERVVSFTVLISSWWQGHKLFNGFLAKHFDKKLSKEFGTEPGLMIDKDFHGHTFVEPARIHQILEKTKDNKALELKAKDAHAKTLYAGVTMHSIFIFILSLAINEFTKWRVESKKAKLKTV